MEFVGGIFDPKMEEIKKELAIENKIKQGAEAMLQIIDSSERGATVPRQEVEETLSNTKVKIAALKKRLQAEGVFLFIL